MSKSLPALAPSVLMLAFAVVLLSGAPAHAQTTILVPGNYPSIQSAINAANNGDTVLVSPGTYVENINFSGKAITVTSSDGPSVTIIDGNHNGSVVTFNQSETVSSVLSGFTIRNGFQNGFWGAGILISSTSPTITRNVVTGNHAAVCIGIAVNGGSPVISNNTISNNDQTGAGYGAQGGGGICVAGSTSTEANPRIVGNVITNNSVAIFGDGGGISVEYFSSPLIQGNLISGNSAAGNGGGIAVGGFNSPVVVGNLIVNNTSLGGGGAGLSVSPRGVIYILNNTIAGNVSWDQSSGVFVTLNSINAVFTNNIIVAAPGQTAVTCDTTYSTDSPVFSYNDAYSAMGSAWTAACDHTSNPGNISSDPLFLSAPNNDFHLALASPLVDGGDNSAHNLPATDFDGNPRIADGNSDGVSVVDLGAFEVTPPSAATLNPDSLSFSAIAVGSNSPAQTATFTNTGATAVQITSFQISGDFAQTSACPQFLALVSPVTLPRGSTCTFNVTFTPTADGPRTGQLTVNQTDGTSLAVALAGVGGTGPFASLSPNSLAFSAQPLGTTSAQQAVTVTNVGAATLNISSIIASGAFSQTNNCASTLPLGASCSISVSFTPSAPGSSSGTLVLQDQFDGLSYSIALSGTGTDFSITASLNSLSFVAGSSAQDGVSVAAVGGSFQNSVALSCAGLPTNVTCILAPPNFVPGTTGAQSTLTIASTASFAGGTFPVTIMGTAGTLSHSAQVSVTITKPGLTLSAPVLNFGLQPVGSSGAMNVTLTNTNIGPVTLSSISASGPFAQSNNCGSVLSVNSSCTVSVTFVPTAYGAASGILRIQDSLDALSYTVSLSGTGVDFAVSAAPGLLTVIRGNAASFAVALGPLGGAYSSSVALSCTGLPTGMTCSLSPQSVVPNTAGTTANLTIATDQHASPLGTSTITIVATSPAASHTTQVQLTVNKNKNN